MPVRKILFCFLLSAVIFNTDYLPVLAQTMGRGATASFSKEGSLLYAISRGDNKKAAELIKKGTDLNAVDKDGNTALMWAARRGNKEVVNLLLSRLVIVDKQDKGGRIALMEALEGYRYCMDSDPAAADYPEVIKALLSRCDDVNYKDRYAKETLLMYAVRAICPDAVKFLLSHGAQVNPKNWKGMTALDIAEEIYSWKLEHSKTSDFKPELTEIKEMLKKAGARYNHKWYDEF